MDQVKSETLYVLRRETRYDESCFAAGLCVEFGVPIQKIDPTFM